MKKVLIASCLAALLPQAGACAETFNQLARKLADRASERLETKKIAVGTFEYVDGRRYAGGSKVSERLSTALIEDGRMTVVERQLISKVLEEVKLATTGVLDESTVKKLQGLGVEAVVTGTLEDLDGDRLEVNARVIRIDNLVAVAAGTIEVDKTGVAASAPKPYSVLVERLASGSSGKLKKKQVAVAPFEYVDGRRSPGSVKVAERLTNGLIEDGRLVVVERRLLGQVLEEKRLAATGILDESTARELRGLGVDALVTGTLDDVTDDATEVNARVIRTDDLVAVAAGSIVVEKTWSDAETPQDSYAAGSQRSRSTWRWYIEGLTGLQQMKGDLSFKSDSLTERRFGLDFNGDGTQNDTVVLSRVSFKKLALSATPPLSLRFGGFGRKWGFGLEFLMGTNGRYSIDEQQTTATVDGVSRTVTLPSGYVTMADWEFAAVDVFRKLVGGNNLFLYAGVGAGVQLLTIKSETISKYGPGSIIDRNIKETDGSYTFRLPVGVRWFFDKDLAAVLEARWTSITGEFSRDGRDGGHSKGNNKFKVSGTQLMAGLTYRFP